MILKNFFDQLWQKIYQKLLADFFSESYVCFARLYSAESDEAFIDILRSRVIYYSS